MSYKFYYVGKIRKSINNKLELYGSHATLKSAVDDSIHRLKEYNQSTAIYGVSDSNEVILINEVRG